MKKPGFLEGQRWKELLSLYFKGDVSDRVSQPRAAYGADSLSATSMEPKAQEEGSIRRLELTNTHYCI